MQLILVIGYHINVYDHCLKIYMFNTMTYILRFIFESLIVLTGYNINSQ